MSHGKEALIKVYFKDPQLPPGQNQREKYVDKFSTIASILEEAKTAFSLPASMQIAFLFKGRKLNPAKNLMDYGVGEDSVLMIVPDRIIGG
jgi:hypothetical protein